MNIEEVELIDWYDGVVEAIYFTTEIEVPYYCSMVAWNVEKNIRVYACIQIRSEISELLDLLKHETDETNWQRIRSQIQVIISKLEGKAEIRDTTISFEESKLKVILPVSEIREQLGQGVEYSVDKAQLKRWKIA